MSETSSGDNGRRTAPASEGRLVFCQGDRIRGCHAIGIPFRISSARRVDIDSARC